MKTIKQGVIYTANETGKDGETMIYTIHVFTSFESLADFKNNGLLISLDGVSVGLVNVDWLRSKTGKISSVELPTRIEAYLNEAWDYFNSVFILNHVTQCKGSYETGDSKLVRLEKRISEILENSSKDLSKEMRIIQEIQL